MKILVIGSGKVGFKIIDHFSKEHEILVANRSAEHFKVDISNSQSIRNLFNKTGKVDAIICAAGEAKWASFDELSEEDYYIGIKSKLMGQVNLVRIGKDFLNDHGSITLTTGILADDPVRKTSSAAMVNGAVHSFVLAASLELTTVRLNVVSTGVVEDAYSKYKTYFPGHFPIPMDKMIKGYERSVLGSSSGQIIRIYE